MTWFVEPVNQQLIRDVGVIKLTIGMLTACGAPHLDLHGQVSAHRQQRSRALRHLAVAIAIPIAIPVAVHAGWRWWRNDAWQLPQPAHRVVQLLPHLPVLWQLQSLQGEEHVGVVRQLHLATCTTTSKRLLPMT